MMQQCVSFPVVINAFVFVIYRKIWYNTAYYSYENDMPVWVFVELAQFGRLNEFYPSLETLVDLANLLGVTTDLLLGENLEHTKLVREMEYQLILHDCNDQERRFLVEATKALKDIMRSDED